MHEDTERNELASEKRLSNKRIARALLCDENNAAESWRIFKIISEFVSGFEVLQKYDLAATFFGSARCGFGDKVYKQTTELSGKLSKAGFAIITGGGGGVMEAANKGAFEAGGPSVGLNIELPSEQVLNKYLNDTQGFHYFFTRKVMLAFASEVYIFLPGGFGTLDELFEIATLIQTKKIPSLPLVLIGKEYWEPLITWLRNDLYMHARAIDKRDLDLFHICDSVDEAFDVIIEQTKNARKRVDAREVPA